MKLSFAAHAISLGSIVAVANADFNGLRRVSTRTAKSDSSHRKLLELKDVGNNLSSKLSACQGDCDDDDDCESGLLCYQRNEFESVPGCSGKGTEKTDYCADRPADYLLFKGGNLGPGALGLCEGDCGADSDCEGDLVCFKRDNFTPVPGCDGTGRRNKDYCIPPDTSSDPGLNPTPAPTACKPEPPVVKHAINSGGDGYTSSSSGITYDADRGFSGGNTYSAAGAVGGTAEDTL